MARAGFSTPFLPFSLPTVVINMVPVTILDASDWCYV
jgi:hypothetical protein